MKQAPDSSSHSGRVFLAALAVTVVSFLTSSILSEEAASGIRAAADSIVTKAGPSVFQLSTVRTAIRHLQGAADDNGTSAGPQVRNELARAELELQDGWAAYVILPKYSGEQALLPAAERALSALHAALTDVSSTLQGKDREAADLILRTRVKPAIEQLDASVFQVLEFNGQHEQDLATRIELLRQRSHLWTIAFDLTSLALAILAATLAIRIVRRNTMLAEERATELDQFAGRVAHDILSPLGAVGLSLAFAQKKSNDPQTQGMLDRGLRCLQHVKEIVDDLLSFARAGAGATSGAADLRAVVQGVADELRAQADAEGIELKVDEIPPCNVACASGALISIVENLVGNAIKHTADSRPGMVQVHVVEQAGAIRVEVQDTGPGIPAGSEEAIFLPFVRRTERVQGLGLGLATVKRLTEAHGGRVGVKSGAERGSIFWFELPKAAPRNPFVPSSALSK